MSFKTALYTLIKDTIGNETVVFADQNAPRPTLPFWTVKSSVTRLVGIDGYSQGVDDNGIIKVRGVREATVQVQRIGLGSVDSVLNLRDDLAKISVLEKFQSAKIAVYDLGDVQDVPYPMDGEHLEPRASMDIFMRFGSELLDDVGLIETVITESEYFTGENGGNTNPDLSQVITVVL